MGLTSSTAASVFGDDELEGWASAPPDAADIVSHSLGVIETALAPLAPSYPDLEFFVQGGYANGTAVTTQSDVDIIVRWPGVEVATPEDANYAAKPYRRFRDEVLDALRARVDRGVRNPRIACRCEVDGRHVDVVPALPYRADGRDDIWLWPTDYLHEPLISWPRTISALIAERDRVAGGHFRPTVRALKGMRDDLWGGEDDAPSFALESLAYVAWPKARSKRKTRTRCVAILEAADQFIPSLHDPSGRQPITSSPPTRDALQAFATEALARLR
jgi:hypothetical protein